MSESKPTASQLANAFNRTMVDHQEKLEILKKTALSHRAEFDQKYEGLIKGLGMLLHSFESATGTLSPKPQEVQQRDKKPTATKRPMRPSRTQKAGRA